MGMLFYQKREKARWIIYLNWYSGKIDEPILKVASKIGRIQMKANGGKKSSVDGENNA